MLRLATAWEQHDAFCALRKPTSGWAAPKDVILKLLGILTGEIPRQEDLEQVLPFEADVARWCTRETDGLFD